MSNIVEAGRTYQNGKREGLALAAFALAIVAFINLLGFEKSLLAGVLAIMALRRGGTDLRAPRWAKPAVAIAIVHIMTVATVVVLFRDKLSQLFLLLHKLS